MTRIMLDSPLVFFFLSFSLRNEIQFYEIMISTIPDNQDSLPLCATRISITLTFLLQIWGSRVLFGTMFPVVLSRGQDGGLGVCERERERELGGGVYKGVCLDFRRVVDWSFGS